MAKRKDIDTRITRLEELLKTARKEKRDKAVAIKKKETKGQNKKDILLGIYVRTQHQREYESYITSSGFDKFLTRDYERALFGFSPLTPQGEASHEDTDSKEITESTTEGVEPEVKDTPKEKTVDAKALVVILNEDKTEIEDEISVNETGDITQEKEESVVLGMEYIKVLKRCREVAKRVAKELGTIAKWDNSAKKWYVPVGTDLKIIACIEHVAVKASKIDPDPTNRKDAFEPPQSFWDEFYGEFPGYPDLK